MPPQQSAVLRWLVKLNIACAVLSGVALLLMMVAGAADVIGTNLDMIGIPSQPVPAAFEFMATMMVVSVFLGASLGQARRTHIRVEVLVNRLPRGGQMLANLIRYGLSAAFFLAIAWFGALGAIHSFNVGEFAPGIINFPVWPARFFLAFGATLISVQCIVDFLGVLSKRFDVEATQGPPPRAPPIS
jgi:TRAP-type C4-dicarboxylate transport system permease small subunit